ncbi:unnamed protein product [Peniophora sp. CBMAI 1063]|nr:unnamed protein product [Peniophora sp. CBMAI 1063]
MEAASPASPPSWAQGLDLSNSELHHLLVGTNSTTQVLIPTILREPDEALGKLRTLYELRTPLGTNTGLWDLMNALVAAISDRDIIGQEGEKEGAAAMMSIMYNRSTFDLLAQVVLSDELFKDWPGWTRCVLKLLTRFIRLPEIMGRLKLDQHVESFLQNTATSSAGVSLSQLVSSLLDQAWTHRQILVHDDVVTWQSQHVPAAPDEIRSELLLLLGSAIDLDQLKSIRNRNFTQLAFLCWFHEHDRYAEHADQLLFALNRFAVTAYTDNDGQNNPTLETFFRHHVHTYYPPLSVCKRIRETFLRAKVLNEDTGALCVILTYFISDRQENVGYILESSLLQAMSACAQLPLQEGKSGPDSSSVHVGYFFALRGCLRGIMGVMICALKDFSFSRGAEVIIKECNVPLLLSWIYRLAAFYHDTPGPDIETHHYALYVTNAFAEMAHSSEMEGKDNPLRRRFVQALKPEWYPVLKLLRRNTTTLVRELYIHKAWERLGKAMGLVEDVERKQYEPRASKLCSLVICRHFTILPPNGLRTCAGCGEVRYHSKQCQTEDWKFGGHKAQCKRMK